MFIKSKHYANAIQKVTIKLGLELGLESADEATVTFREPSEGEVLKLRAAENDEQRLEAFKEIFKLSIIDHDFWEDETVKMDDGEVIDLLFQKVSTTDKLIKEYSASVFHFQASEA